MRVIKVLIRKILDRLKQGTLSEIETLIITKQRLQWNLKDRRSLGKDQDGQIEWVCVYACVCLFVCVRVGEGEWQPGRIGVRMLMGGRRAGYDEKEISLFHPHLPTHKNMVSQQARCSGHSGVLTTKLFHLMTWNIQTWIHFNPVWHWSIFCCS